MSGVVKVYIESSHSDSKDSSNFVYNFGHTLNVKRFGVTDIQIASSVFNINSSNNTLTLAGVTKTLLVGQYDSSSLLAELQVQFPTYTISVDRESKTYTFSNVNSFTVGSSTLGAVLGFRVLPTASSLSHTSDSIYDLSGIPAMYVLSDWPTNSILKNSGMNVVQKVNLSSFGITTAQYHRDRLNYNTLKKPLRTDNIRLKLVDKNLNPISNHQRHWSCILWIEGQN